MHCHADISGHLWGRLAVLLLLSQAILALGFVGGVSAQDDDGQDVNLNHWAYASAFGTGIYLWGDEIKTYVIRIQPKYTKRILLKKYEDKRELFIEFIVPVTFGVQTFEYEDILVGDFPTDIKQISLTPGVELEIPVSRRWALRPFGHFGWGTETGDEKESAWIYWGGIKSRWAFQAGKFDFALLNGYAIYGYIPSRGSSDNMSALTNGLELDYPLGNLNLHGDQLYLKTNLINYFFIDNDKLMVSSANTIIDLCSEWEVGVSIGKKTKMKIWFYKLDRIGLAYRFSKNTRGIRLYLDTSFH